MRVRIEPDALGLVDKLNAARPGRGPLSGTPRAHQLMSQAAAATRLTCKRNSERRDVNSVHVFVAGASGVLGRRLVPQLIARGHRVTATTTRSDRLGSKNWAADGVVLDGLDGAMVGEAVAQGRAVPALAAT